MSPFGTNQPLAPEQSLFIQVADGKRVFLANCIDAFLVILIAVGTIFALPSENHSLIRGAHMVDSGLLWLAAQLPHIALTATVGFMALLLYQCSAAALSGYTPGRRVAGIVLVHKKGRELTRTRLIMRSFLSIISWVLLGAGYFLPLLDKYHRTLHDICTQTILVQRKLQIP